MAEGSTRGHSAIFLSPRTSQLRASVISYGSDQVDGGVVPPSDVPVSHHGTLQKIGRKLKLWKSRYFEVQGQQMFYYKTERKRHCLGDVDLKNCYHVEPSDAANFGYAFEVLTVARTHLFAARTEEERQKWIDVIKENMGGKAVYEASKATLGARTKTGRRPRGERNRTVDSVPVQVIQAEGEDQPTSPTTMTPQTKRQSRVSKLITRMTSFKSGGARVQRPLSSYHPPTSRHANEPAEESQKPQDLQKEQTVQVEVTPNDKDTPASATLAKEDSLPPNIVVKEPTPEPPEQEGTTPREGTPPHEGSSPQATESGSSRAHVDENHVVSHSQAEEPHPQAEEPHPQAEEPHPQAEEPHPQAEEPHPQAEEPHPQAEEPHPQAEEPHPQAEEPHPQAEEPHPQAEEPHPQVERTVLKPHPLQATHTAPKEREPSAPRDEPAVHVEEGQHVENTAKETAVAATTAVEKHEEEAGLTEGTTASAPLSTEDTTRQVEEHAASPAGEKASEEVPATQEPLPATIAAAASNSLAEPSPKAPSKPNSETPSKPSAGVKRFLPSELPTVPTVPTLPAEVREYLGRKFAADAIQEHLAALSSEGEEPADLPLPPMYRSFSFSGDHEDDIAPSMNEMRLFLANCA